MIEIDLAIQVFKVTKSVVIVLIEGRLDEVIVINFLPGCQRNAEPNERKDGIDGKRIKELPAGEL